MVGPSSGATLTRSVEDYLKAIYELELGGSPAQTSAIANALEVAPPSVSGMRVLPSKMPSKASRAKTGCVVRTAISFA